MEQISSAMLVQSDCIMVPKSSTWVIQMKLSCQSMHCSSCTASWTPKNTAKGMMAFLTDNSLHFHWWQNMMWVWYSFEVVRIDTSVSSRLTNQQLSDYRMYLNDLILVLQPLQGHEPGLISNDADSCTSQLQCLHSWSSLNALSVKRRIVCA